MNKKITRNLTSKFLTTLSWLYRNSIGPSNHPQTRQSQHHLFLQETLQKTNTFSWSALFHDTFCSMSECTENIRSLKYTEMLLWMPSHLIACNLKISWIVIYVCVCSVYTHGGSPPPEKAFALHCKRKVWLYVCLRGCCQPLPPLSTPLKCVCVCVCVCVKGDSMTIPAHACSEAMWSTGSILSDLDSVRRECGEREGGGGRGIPRENSIKREEQCWLISMASGRRKG